MSLHPLSDVSAADWFVDSDADWWTKVTLGPPGFEAYARVLYPLDDGQLAGNDSRTRSILMDVLREHTTSPHDCFFGLWEGCGYIEATWQWTETEDGRTYRASGPEPPSGVDAEPCSAAAFADDILDGPKVTLQHRKYYLFTGPLEMSGKWGARDQAPGLPRSSMDGPHLAWPADHAWFLAADTDPDWIGVGGSQTLIDELVADARLNVTLTAYDSANWETQ